MGRTTESLAQYLEKVMKKNLHVSENRLEKTHKKLKLPNVQFMTQRGDFLNVTIWN